MFANRKTFGIRGIASELGRGWVEHCAHEIYLYTNFSAIMQKWKSTNNKIFTIHNINFILSPVRIPIVQIYSEFVRWEGCGVWHNDDNNKMHWIPEIHIFYVDKSLRKVIVVWSFCFCSAIVWMTRVYGCEQLGKLPNSLAFAPLAVRWRAKRRTFSKEFKLFGFNQLH